MALYKWASTITAVLASLVWLWSALIRIPDTTQMKIGGDESPSGYMKRQSRVSAVAAVFSFLSAVITLVGGCACS